MTLWTLKDGLETIRAIQPLLREFQYHVALGGGVLNNGESNKDLDLYFLPLDSDTLKPEQTEKLIQFLNILWTFNMKLGYGSDLVFGYKAQYRTGAGKRVDVFVAPNRQANERDGE